MKRSGEVTTQLRPDDRLFLRFHVDDPSAYAPLVEEVAGAGGGPLYTMVDADDRAAVDALHAAGFETEMEGENFQIRFEDGSGRRSERR